MDAIQPFVEATFTDLESRNPGLEFRTHWITKLGFGRDEEYAPYTNETRDIGGQHALDLRLSGAPARRGGRRALLRRGANAGSDEPGRRDDTELHARLRRQRDLHRHRRQRRMGHGRAAGRHEFERHVGRQQPRSPTPWRTCTTTACAGRMPTARFDARVAAKLDEAEDALPGASSSTAWWRSPIATTTPS